MKAIRFRRGHTRANSRALLLACAIGPFATAHASTYEPAGLNFGISSFFDGLEELKLPSIGRPVTREDIDAAIEQEVNARHGRSRDRRR